MFFISVYIFDYHNIYIQDPYLQCFFSAKSQLKIAIIYSFTANSHARCGTGFVAGPKQTSLLQAMPTETLSSGVGTQNCRATPG
jgi:hypothetical protein